MTSGSRFSRTISTISARSTSSWFGLLRSEEHTSELQSSTRSSSYLCDILDRYHEGLIASSACVSSWLAFMIECGDSIAVNDYFDRMLKLFGDDFWVEIQPHDFDDQRTLNIELVRLA